MSVLAYVGNFFPPHSTENHLRTAWINQGHTVIRIQEGDNADYDTLMKNIHAVDFVMWTRTGDLADKWGKRKQVEMLAKAKSLNIPTVGYHLDRWWGLDRESQVWNEPFFLCSVVITADGGHQEQFLRSGVNHVWMPPAVSLGETVHGTYRQELASNIAFVGSWQGGYHKEWTHRPQLVEWLNKNYGSQTQFWPKRGEHAVRGSDLRDLYASVKVVVGDSCLVGGATRYWSDRIPETLGRGGFLIHPAVVGLEEHFDTDVHLKTWNIGDWDGLKSLIDHFLRDDRQREREIIADCGRKHVIANHTYDCRVQQILKVIGKGSA